MANVRVTVCRGLALLAILAGMLVAFAPGAGAAPSIPGVPDCKDAPSAQLPGSGITGFLDPGPSTPPEPLDPFVENPRTSVYEQYGYAGLGWHTYDLGCGGGMRDVEASIDTAAGNFLMSAATWGTAASNGLHNKVSHPEQYMGPLDDVVTAVTQRLHDSIWSPWGATALIGVGALLLFYSLSGRLSSVTSAAAWALLVLAVVAGIGQYPTRVATFFDQTVSTSVASINAGVSGLTNLPASSDPARAQGAVVVDRVLYDNWLRGQLGASDSPAAKRWGPDLFKASAFTWAEARQAEEDPEAGRRIAETKAENWKKAAAAIEKEDPVAYGYLQGKSGGRAGTGLMVALGSTFTLLFRLVADIFLFAGLVMLRLLVMMFPAVAVVGVMAPMAAVVRRVFSMGGAAVVNVIAFSAGSAVHTTVVSAVLSRSTDTGMGVLGIVLCLVATLAAFVILYPLLSFNSILGRSGGPRWLKRGSREAWNYTSRRMATKHGVEDADEDGHGIVGGPGQSGTFSSAPNSRSASPGAHVRVESYGRPAFLAVTRARETDPPHPRQRELAAVGAAKPSAPESAPNIHTTTASRSTTVPGGHGARSGQSLTGVLVDEVPADAKELPNLAHDSQTEVRRDGIGPRIYDPETKQTALSSQSRVD